MEEIEADFNPDFITKMLTRMDWNAFVQTSLLVGMLIKLKIQPESH